MPIQRSPIGGEGRANEDFGIANEGESRATGAEDNANEENNAARGGETEDIQYRPDGRYNAHQYCLCCRFSQLIAHLV